MARKRKSTAAMELISKEKPRQAMFEKRKKSLKKAAHELSTLCGVGVGMIVSNEGRSEAEVWPPAPDPVARIIELHETGLGQDGMCNRVYGVAEYYKEKREKVEEKIKKMREERYAKWEEKSKGFSEDQWRELGGFLKARIGAVRERISSVLKTRVFEQQQQQQWGYFGTRDYIGSLEGSRNVCPDTKFWVNPLIQERNYNNVGDLVEGLRNPYLESEIYVPEIARQHQDLAIYEAGNGVGYVQNEEMMMMSMMNSDGASCSEGIDNYTYFLNHSCYENSGMQAEMVEPLMSYDHMPNEETMMLQNWQGLMQTEMMEKVDIGDVEPLMSYDMPNDETRAQNWQGQTTQEGYYVGK